MIIQVTPDGGLSYVAVPGDGIKGVSVQGDVTDQSAERLFNTMMSVLVTELRELRRVVCLASGQAFLDPPFQEP